MKAIQQCLPNVPSISSSTSGSLEIQIQRYNDEQGTLKGQNCQLCKNKGYIMILDEGYTALKPCDCQKKRETRGIVEKSGMKKLIQDYTFETYDSKAMWQRIIKEKALAFIHDQGHWFFIGGQVGAGKTHICTAIVNELMNLGNQTLYMLWRDEVVKLKTNLVEGSNYQTSIQAYKTIKVLYIDDLFKSEKGKSPSTADINIAFEILNARYQDKDLITIISSEKVIKELLIIDEAIGSRIYEMTGDYCVQLNNNERMNMRLRERNLNEQIP
jgi:DNA replication protein DnaC